MVLVIVTCGGFFIKVEDEQPLVMIAELFSA
jgi:hypothetical protein